ncbi:MAG TPA: ABC transporter permease [Candidatus Saccharimonadales bacterium]|nr:ABC transporter permease [Candidatus Saccharimonadales bacterium]
MKRLLAALRRGLDANLRFAIGAIMEFKLRSSLTILGIIVGVTTVMAMVAIVTGFNNNVIGNLQAFGANRIEIRKYDDRFGPGGPRGDEERRRRNLTVEDAQALRESLPEATVASLVAYPDGIVHVKNGSLEARNPYVLGADEFYPTGTSYNVARGRFFTPQEVAHSALVVVLGSDVREAIFPQEDPLGKDITVDGMRYRVVGVLEKKGSQFGYSPDNKVVLPYGTFDRQYGFRVRRDGVVLNVVPKRMQDLDSVIEKATAVLRVRRKVPFNKPDDFAIITPDQMISQFRAITGGVTGAMIFIALISLLIGGVGVMNIMLVSVTQRTREIGVRRAVGALKLDIIGQFLIEAMTLSSVGGALGVALGLLISAGVKATVPALPTAIPLWSPMVGLLVSVGVGVVFGSYPAIKASRLDPIDALRWE